MIQTPLFNFTFSMTQEQVIATAFWGILTLLLIQMFILAFYIRHLKVSMANAERQHKAREKINNDLQGINTLSNQYLDSLRREGSSLIEVTKRQNDEAKKYLEAMRSLLISINPKKE